MSEVVVDLQAPAVVPPLQPGDDLAAAAADPDSALLLKLRLCMYSARGHLPSLIKQDPPIRRDVDLESNADVEAATIGLRAWVRAGGRAYCMCGEEEGLVGRKASGQRSWYQ